MKKILFLLLITISEFVYSSSYECKVMKKYSVDLTNIMDSNEIKKWNFSLEIIDEKVSKLKRCSYVTSKKRVDCDSYDVDKIEFDPYVKIKKFYVFKSQFDVQLFPDMTFIENNGRGSISYGKCEKL